MIAFYSRKTNLEKFCDIFSSFDEKVINEIRQELQQLSILKPFYIEEKKNYQSDGDMFKLLKSFSSLLKDSLIKMPENQRLILGESYQLYSEMSNTVHGYSGGPKFDLQSYHTVVDGLYARVFILASCILKNLATIGHDCLKDSTITEALNSLETDNLPNSFLICIGDKVLVKGKILAKVTDVSVSKYGCKKYRVEYVDKREEWTFAFDQDWFLLKDLKKLI